MTDHDSPRGWHTALLAFAGICEVAGVVAQGFLINQFLASRHLANCGESCSMTGMWLAMLLLYAAPFALMGTAAAIFFAFRARRSRNLYGTARTPIAVHGLLATMPLYVACAMHMYDVPLPEPSVPKYVDAPETDKDRYVAGAAFATDNGIADVAQCAASQATANAAWVRGCEAAVRRGGR